MKKAALLVIVLLSLFLAAAPAMAAPAIVINGYQLTSELAPVVQGGQVYLPLRSVATALGTTIVWDSATQTATVTKNSMTLSVDLQDKSVVLNGTLLMPGGSVLIDNGRILIPAQALEKALGATVTMDSVSGNVYIDYQEKVDGMTPEQLLLKSAEVAKSYGTYKFTETLTMSTTAQGKSITVPMQIQGQVKEPGQAYTVGTTTLPGVKGVMKTESYVDNGKIYINMTVPGKPATGWQEMPMPAFLSNWQTQLSNDPAASVDMIKQIGGIISAGTPQTVDGVTYDVVRVTIDPFTFKKWLANMIIQAAPAGQQAQAPQTTQNALDAMQIKDFAYEMFINPNTYLMTKGYLTMSMTINVPTSTTPKTLSPVTITMGGNFIMYDFGQPVQMPTVPTK